jgi:TatA/E family protein of Tat protein translocase
MLSVPHLIVLFLVALIVLGPDKLPQVARVLGRTMAEFRRITSDFRYQIEGEVRDFERQRMNEETERTAVLPPAVSASAPAGGASETVPATPARPATSEAAHPAADGPHGTAPGAEPHAPPAEQPVAAGPSTPPEKPNDGESRPA